MPKILTFNITNKRVKDIDIEDVYLIYETFRSGEAIPLTNVEKSRVRGIFSEMNPYTKYVDLQREIVNKRVEEFGGPLAFAFACGALKANREVIDMLFVTKKILGKLLPNSIDNLYNKYSFNKYTACKASEKTLRILRTRMGQEIDAISTLIRHQEMARIRSDGQDRREDQDRDRESDGVGEESTKDGGESEEGQESEESEESENSENSENSEDSVENEDSENEIHAQSIIPDGLREPNEEDEEEKKSLIHLSDYSEAAQRPEEIAQLEEEKEEMHDKEVNRSRKDSEKEKGYSKGDRISKILAKIIELMVQNDHLRAENEDLKQKCDRIRS